jgi:hypothetical protein
MRNRLVRVLPFALLTFAASCGDDNPVDPSGDDPGPTGLQFDDFQAAALVIGQGDKSSGVTNAGAGGGGTNAVGLVQPDGAGCGALYVPDELNHRVLGFTGVPAADGAVASFALGQPDLTSSAEGTTAQNMSYPTDCTVADGKLFVVDSQNDRVLIWNSLPTSSVPADVVVGQADFTSAVTATSQTGFAAPFRVAVAGGRMFVSDIPNHRVLIWNSIPTTNGAPASVVLGQTDFTTAVPGLTASRFRSPAALWTDGRRLVVGDLENGRLLIWNSIPATNGAPADVVVGAADFVSAGSTTPSATSVGSPIGTVSDGVSLFVADETSHRVLIYTPFPTANGAAATGVLGQSSFTSSAFNDINQDGTPDGPSARTFSGPRDVEVIGNRLFVADEFNNRVLVFDSK